MKLVRLNKSDGTWDKLKTSWLEECKTYDEDFEAYAQASLGTLEDECDDEAVDENTGVFALEDNYEKYHAVCFLNNTPLKGYQGNVLRVRHLVLSPYYDFEDLELEDYSEILSDYFVSLVECSNDTLVSKYIKIHYRSPYDRTFFAAFGMSMRSTGRFQAIESKGMWLHLTKS
jgi:hypothetical protein